MLKVHIKNFGSVAILCLQGRIVSGETAALRKAVDSQSQVTAVVLDLTRVSTIDAHGLGVLLDLREQLRSKGNAFRLMNVTPLVNHVLQITRLNTVFETTSAEKILSAVSQGRPASALKLVSCPV